MSNEYVCRLEVSGAPNAVQAFVAHFGSEDFSLHSFLPAPERGATKASWLAVRWGISSDIECRGGFLIEGGKAVKDFGNFGEVRVPVFGVLAQRFRALTFELFFLDPVWQITGLVIWKDGRILMKERFGFEDWQEIEDLSPWHGRQAQIHAADMDAEHTDEG